MFTYHAPIFSFLQRNFHRKSQSSMNQVPRILASMDGAAAKAAEELLHLVYDELRKLAGRPVDENWNPPWLPLPPVANAAFRQLVLQCAGNNPHQFARHRSSGGRHAALRRRSVPPDVPIHR